MNCGLTILGVYAGVCSLTIIILGSLLLSGGDCEEKSLMESCKELQVAGGVTEVRNKIVKFDILNQDNGRIGLNGETGEACPACAFGWLTTLEVIALTLLGVLGLTNLGRCCRYLVKLRTKHNLKKETEKLQKKAELRKNILAELGMERGNEIVPRADSASEDARVPRVPAWEEAELSV